MKKHKIIHELEYGIFYYMKASEKNIRLYSDSSLRYRCRIPKVGGLSRALNSTYLWFFKHEEYKHYPISQLGASHRELDDFLKNAKDAFPLLSQLEVLFDGRDMIDLSTYRRSYRIKKIKRRNVS